MGKARGVMENVCDMNPETRSVHCHIHRESTLKTLSGVFKLQIC
jgi:hypothetical protein